MRRRFSYALTAGVLSSGAPAGLLGIRPGTPGDEMSLHRVRNEISADRAAYMYIGGGTALIFALFGTSWGATPTSSRAVRDRCADAIAERARVWVAPARRNQALEALPRAAEPAVPRCRRPEGHQRPSRAPGGQRSARQVAAVIRSELRETDTGARWGGDDSPSSHRTPTGEAVSFAERIRVRSRALQTGR